MAGKVINVTLGQVGVCGAKMTVRELGYGCYHFYYKKMSVHLVQLQVYCFRFFFSDINECLCSDTGWIAGEVCFLRSNASGLDIWLVQYYCAHSFN